MYHQLVAKGCRSSSTIFKTKMNLLIFAIFIILGVIKSSIAMPPREYGYVEKVSVARMTYRNDPEPEYEDEEPTLPRYTENRGGRGEALFGSRDRERDNPSFGNRHGTEIEQRNNFIAVPKSTCVSKTICENTMSPYPKEHIRSLISTNPSLKLLANDDSIDVDNRFGQSEGEIVCDSERKVIYPEAGQTKTGLWVFVVQDPENGLTQGVRVENCNVQSEIAGGTCQIVGTQVDGYETSCKQKYVSRVLAAINNNGTAMSVPFTIPASCCCEIKVRTISRLGIGPRNDQSPAPPRRSGRRYQTPK